MASIANADDDDEDSDDDDDDDSKMFGAFRLPILPPKTHGPPPPVQPLLPAFEYVPPKAKDEKGEPSSHQEVAAADENKPEEEIKMTAAIDAPVASSSKQVAKPPLTFPSRGAAPRPVPGRLTAHEKQNKKLVDDIVFDGLLPANKSSVNEFCGSIRTLWSEEQRQEKGQFAWTCEEQALMVEHMLKLEKDLIVCLRTGAGKSLAFTIVPYMEPNAYTILVIPFTALMNDTLTHLDKHGVPFQIGDGDNTSPLHPERNLVVVSAENAKNREWLKAVKTADATQPVIRAIIDEGHEALSGSQYRTPLTRLYSSIRFRALQVVLLSATIPPRIVPDLVDLYGLDPEHTTIRSSSCRKELKYEMTPFVASNEVEKETQQILARQRKRFGPEDRAMVFVPYVDLGRSLATLLECNFYGGSNNSKEQRDQVLSTWRSGEYNVIVGTTGLMSGIDYAHVRLVIFALPPIEALPFVQGCGRAGRDGKPATCVVVRRFPPRNAPPPIPQEQDMFGKMFMRTFCGREVPETFPQKCLRYQMTEYVDGKDQGGLLHGLDRLAAVWTVCSSNDE